MKRAHCYLEKGEGRTRVCLAAQEMGKDLVVYLYNENAHLGSVAVSEFDRESGRVSTSLITLLGHKDDAVAQKAAYEIGKATRRPVCAIAGIHLDAITSEEIEQIQRNAQGAIDDFVKQELQRRG